MILIYYLEEQKSSLRVLIGMPLPEPLKVLL
jgi:hypothetical protein